MVLFAPAIVLAVWAVFIALSGEEALGSDTVVFFLSALAVATAAAEVARIQRRREMRVKHWKDHGYPESR